MEHRPREERIQLLSSKTAGATPLIAACRNGHYDVAEYLIKSCGADVELAGSGNFYSRFIPCAYVRGQFKALFICGISLNVHAHHHHNISKSNILKLIFSLDFGIATPSKPSRSVTTQNLTMPYRKLG